MHLVCVLCWPVPFLHPFQISMKSFLYLYIDSISHFGCRFESLYWVSFFCNTLGTRLNPVQSGNEMVNIKFKSCMPCPPTRRWKALASLLPNGVKDWLCECTKVQTQPSRLSTCVRDFHCVSYITHYYDSVSKIKCFPWQMTACILGWQHCSPCGSDEVAQGLGSTMLWKNAITNWCSKQGWYDILLLIAVVAAVNGYLFGYRLAIHLFILLQVVTILTWFFCYFTMGQIKTGRMLSVDCSV